jgi:hypothetical protein
MSYEGLPSHMHIDGVRYEVMMEANITPATDRKTQGFQEDGEFDAATQEVRVRPGMARDYAKHIVVHEALHGMWEHAGLTAAGGPAEMHEELVVTAMARRLVTFIRDNPELIAFLAK